MTAFAPDQLRLVKNRLHTGYLPGWQQPVSVIELTATADCCGLLDLGAFHGQLQQWLPELPVLSTDPANKPSLFGEFLLTLVQALLNHAEWPLLAAPTLQLRQQGEQVQFLLMIPTFSLVHTAPNAAFDWLLRRLQAGALEPQHQAGFQHLLELFRAQAPVTGITARMLEAARDNGIPWLHISHDIFQFGWGKRSCLMDGSFTDATSNIGVRLVRHKIAGAHALRMAGLPVPEHRQVHSAEQAVQYAQQLGYPVVVKPVDLDGGLGVSPDLHSATAVQAAWQRASVLSKNVMVEKHLPGSDHRVYVLHGKVISVVLRIPGGVTGDGRRSVRELLVEVNADPRRQKQARRMKPIELDAEALELLTAAGLHPDAVPAQGRFVRLRRTANIMGGGSPLHLALDTVHADNLRLCERAAKLLRLDICGIDLLMPDISRSWLETGAGICEVNSQPQLPASLPALILNSVLSAQGRIPVVLIIDADAQQQNVAPWWQTLESLLAQRDIVVGFSSPAAVNITGHPLTGKVPATTANAAHILLRDPTLAAAVFIITDANQLVNGAPVDQASLLVVTGSAMPPTALLSLIETLAQRSKALWFRKDSAAMLAASEAGQKLLTSPHARTLAAAQPAKAVVKFVEAAL